VWGVFEVQTAMMREWHNKFGLNQRKREGLTMVASFCDDAVHVLLR
jgi:hypothetical protein